MGVVPFQRLLDLLTALGDEMSMPNRFVVKGLKVADGLMVGGVFYPFMVDCFPCNSTGRANVSPARACSTCDDTGMVRNPALEWQQQWRPSFAYAWRTDTLSEHSTYASLETRWVAVGVKGNNK